MRRRFHASTRDWHIIGGRKNLERRPWSKLALSASTLENREVQCPTASPLATAQTPRRCEFLPPILSCARTDRSKRLIPKADRKKIHEYLFREGVLVAKKDFESKHGEIDTKNLYVGRQNSRSQLQLLISCARW